MCSLAYFIYDFIWCGEKNVGGWNMVDNLYQVEKKGKIVLLDEAERLSFCLQATAAKEWS